ncbi:MAG: diaminopimelate decarboxylase [Caulobacterales bacterium 32-69-10]|nr:MAG: diaminopimelate decarboxylase [Caulobacterales bacterium 32-69-10]
MDAFTTRSGELWCEDVRLADVAAAVGAPVYVYSATAFEQRYRDFSDAFGGEALVAYAVKANSNLSVLKTLFDLGAGADTVSEGEIRRALAAGADPGRIVFSGVGKTSAEIAFALKTGVAEINVEAEPELARVAEVAASLDLRAPVAFRVNPDVAAGGHAKIATGKAENKFGVSFAEAKALYAQASNHAHLNPVGVACHIGSQILDLDPFEAAFRRMRGLVESLRAEGLSVERLDLGGGLGVDYFNGAPPPPSVQDYAAMVRRVTDGLDVKLAFEPGRWISANAGVLMSQVIHVYTRPEGRRFLVVDAAMNDLVRPAMYDAYQDIRPVQQRAGAAGAYDVVGPVCETGDTFARDRVLPPFAAGDLLAFMSAGAYGAVMSSEYNTRPLVPEVLVRGDRFAVVRARPTYEEMLAREPMAAWL